MKKLLTLLTIMMMTSMSAFADHTITVAADASYNGVLVTTPDGTTTYALSEMPRISYTTDGTTVTAHLFVNSSKEAVASVVLKDGKTLSAFWGTYSPSSIDGVTSEKATTYTKNGRKYITGGRLIIVKDGKLYDAAGNEIK